MRTKTVSPPGFSSSVPNRPRPLRDKRPRCTLSGLTYSHSIPAEVDTVVVFAHGMRTSGAAAMRTIRTRLREMMPNAAIYAPDGPLHPHDDAHDRGHAWAGLPGAYLFSLRRRAREDLDRSVYHAAGQLNAFCDEVLARHNLTRKNLLLMGWSEGGMVATHAGLAHPEACAGIFNFSGNYYDLRPPQNTSPVFLSRNQRDNIICRQLHYHSLTALKQQGVNAFIHETTDPTGSVNWIPSPNPQHVPDSSHPDEKPRYRRHQLVTHHMVHPDAMTAAHHFSRNPGVASAENRIQPLHTLRHPRITLLMTELCWNLMNKRMKSKLRTPLPPRATPAGQAQGLFRRRARLAFGLLAAAATGGMVALGTGLSSGPAPAQPAPATVQHHPTP